LADGLDIVALFPLKRRSRRDIFSVYRQHFRNPVHNGAEMDEISLDDDDTSSVIVFPGFFLKSFPRIHHGNDVAPKVDDAAKYVGILGTSVTG